MKMTDQEIVNPVDDSQVQLNEKPIVNIKKKYKEKRFAPCIQCYGERRADACTDSRQCEEWREYTMRRNYERKAKEYNRIRVSRSLYLFVKV